MLKMPENLKPWGIVFTLALCVYLGSNFVAQLIIPIAGIFTIYYFVIHDKESTETGTKPENQGVKTNIDQASMKKSVVENETKTAEYNINTNTIELTTNSVRIASKSPTDLQREQLLVQKIKEDQENRISKCQQDLKGLKKKALAYAKRFN